MSDGRPEWDDDKATALLGRKVIVGITVRPKDGSVEQHQMHGTVTEAGQESGIFITLEGKRQGETYRLPPDPAAFHPAAPGEYRLRSTEEIVVDPDFTSTWTVERPD